MSLFLKTPTLVFLSFCPPLVCAFHPNPTLLFVVTPFSISLFINVHFHILNIPIIKCSGDQKKQLNGKGAPTKSTAVKAKPTPAKPAKSGSYKLVVKSPMPTKAAKSTSKPFKGRPTAVEILLSKINPITPSKSTISLIKNGNAKSAAAKTNGLAKANNNGNGRATGAKANGNGKADPKPTAPARVSGNGKVVVEKKVINTKSSTEKKSSGNGKVTIVTKSNGAAEKKTSGSGKATIEVKDIKVKVNGKPENKVAGEAKANGNGKIITVVEKKFTNDAANRAKTETTTRAKTEKVIKVEKIEKTTLSTAKSATKLAASKAAKPTKAAKFDATTLTKATKATATAGKTQARAEVKEVTQVKTVVTKVPLVKTTVSKAAKNVVERVTMPRKVASTSMPVRPTPPRPTKSKMAVDINVKSQHKPFPPFGKTALSGTTIPGRKVTNGYQQVQWRGPCVGQSGRSVWPICPTVARSFHHSRCAAKFE